MVFIVINKNFIKITVTLIFIFLFAFSIYRYITGMNERNLYRSTFLLSSYKSKNIEIFDIDRGCVNKVIPVNDFALAEAKKYIQEITGMYAKVKVLPDRGFIINIPYEPKIKFKNKWLNAYNITSIDKVFIIFPQEDRPYLLILDNKERPYCYHFKGDTNRLLKSLNYEPDNPR